MTTPASPIVPVSPAPERAHHPMGPSSLGMFEACARYTREDKEAGEAAIEGTYLHDCVEGDSTQGLDPFEAVQVQMCIDYKRQAILDMGPGATVHQEIKVEIPGLTYGYLDCLILSADGTRAHLLDYKFGRIQVEDAENNIQGWAYLIGALEQFPNMRFVKVTFLQPKLQEMSEAEFDLQAEWPRFMTRLKRIFERAADKSLPATPAYFACQFCGSKATCPELAQIVVSASTKMGPVIVPDVYRAELAVSKPAAMRTLLDFARLVAEWAKAQRSAACDIVLTTEMDVPGYTVSTRTDKSVVADWPRLFAAVQTVDPGITKEEFGKLFEIRWTKLAEALKVRAVKGQKTAAEKALKDKLDEEGLLQYSEPTTFLKIAKNEDDK